MRTSRRSPNKKRTVQTHNNNNKTKTEKFFKSLAPVVPLPSSLHRGPRCKPSRPTGQASSRPSAATTREPTSCTLTATPLSPLSRASPVLALWGAAEERHGGSGRPDGKSLGGVPVAEAPEFETVGKSHIRHAPHPPPTQTPLPPPHPPLTHRCRSPRPGRDREWTSATFTR